MLDKQMSNPHIERIDRMKCSLASKSIIAVRIKGGYRTKEDWERYFAMEKAKKGNYGRYAAVNLCNYHTVEFRLFRGTLKHNTLIAAIELVNRICDAAMYNTDENIAKLSWSEFVAGITEPELIQYLKERQLYINEEVRAEEEM